MKQSDTENDKLIIDTNLWVSSCLGKRVAILRDILLDSKYEIYICKELTNEVEDVLSRPKIRKYITDGDVHDLHELMQTCCKMASIKRRAKSVIRDIDDLYLLSLAETIHADIIISGDKDLLVLGSYLDTKIMSLSDFANLFLK